MKRKKQKSDSLTVEKMAQYKEEIITLEKSYETTRNERDNTHNGHLRNDLTHELASIATSIKYRKQQIEKIIWKYSGEI